MRRVLHVTIIVSALVCAVLAVVGVFTDRLDAWAEDLLTSSFVVLVGATLLMVVRPLFVTKRYPPLPAITVFLIGVATLLAVYALWARAPSRDLVTAARVAGALAIGAGYLCALLPVQLVPQYTWMRRSTVAFAVVATVLTTYALGTDGASADLGKAAVFFVVLTLIGTVLVVLYRVISRPLLEPADQMPVPHCPHCGRELPRSLADVFH